MIEPMYALPTSALTLYPKDSITSYRLYRSDYTTWTDILSSLSDFTALRYTPRSHLNRSLYRGYLVPMVNAPGDQFSPLLTPTLSQFTSTPQHLQRAKVAPTSLGGALRYPYNQVSTQVAFTWEGGLFDGNLLDLRFSRNLSRNLSMSVIMNYHNLKRTNYSYPGGSLENLYVAQPKIVGYNPESSSRKTNVTLRWQKKSTLEFSYTYSELKHDLVYQDSVAHKTGLDTFWIINSDYLSQASMWGEFPFTDKVSLKIAGELDKNANNKQSFVDASKIYAGEHRQIGSAAILYKPVINDTISVSGTFTRHETRQYGDNTTLIHQNDILLSNSFSLSNSEALKVQASGGFTTINAGSTQNFFPNITGSALVKARNFELSGWGSYAIAPINITYDTLLVQPQSSLGDLYGGGGVEAAFSHPAIRTNIGYSYVTGLEKNTILSYWQSQTTPYSNPGHVFSASVASGEWKGLSFYSNWLFSDEMPRVKSQSQISLHVHKNQRSRHLYIDLINSYWSKRPDDFGSVNGIPFGGVNAQGMWNRAIINLDIKTTVEVKSFRVYWKIGNILHRTQSYVPGYQMPGINFRWGFSWSIIG